MWAGLSITKKSLQLEITIIYKCILFKSFFQNKAQQSLSKLTAATKEGNGFQAESIPFSAVRMCHLNALAVTQFADVILHAMSSVLACWLKTQWHSYYWHAFVRKLTAVKLCFNLIITALPPWLHQVGNCHCVDERLRTWDDTEGGLCVRTLNEGRLQNCPDLKDLDKGVSFYIVGRRTMQ